MKVFVTGATGFIGRNLIMKLAREGVEVHALYRNLSKTRELQHERIEWFQGDLDNRDSLKKAMKGCTHACHLGAFAALLIRNPGIIYKQNVQGTVNVLECAREEGVGRVVFVSTAGVFGPSSGGEFIDETAPYPENMITHYIRSKIQAEQKVLEYVRSGMDICTVNPTRVFGPGLLSTGNAARITDLYLKGKWRILPGNGRAIGNYVFVDDVSEGIRAALERGRRGERYLLGGENLSMREFLNTVVKLSGREKAMIPVPFFIILWIAYLLLFIAKISGWTPPFTPGEIRRFKMDYLVSSGKAGKELKYQPRPFEEGMKNTIAWLNNLDTP